MKIYERFVSGFLVGFRFVAFGFGAGFTTVWLCLCPVSLSFSLSLKSLNYFLVKFKISKRQAKLHFENGMCVHAREGVKEAAWCIATEVTQTSSICGLIKFRVHFSLNFKIICTC